MHYPQTRTCTPSLNPIQHGRGATRAAGRRFRRTARAKRRLRRSCAVPARSCSPPRSTSRRVRRCHARPLLSTPWVRWLHCSTSRIARRSERPARRLVAWDGDGRHPPHRALVRSPRRRARRRATGARGVRGRARAAAGAGAGRSAPGRPRRAVTGRDRPALYPSGGGPRGRLGRADDRHDGDRLGQVAVLQPADARRPLRRLPRPRAVPLPDEGARPGPGARAERVRPGEADPPGDLRRRHPARGALGHPPAVEPDPHEPRHAPRRDPAQPRCLGRLLREPRRRRRRRGARLPRGVRRARRQRPAPAAAGRGRLRHGAALPLRQRDDRQPGRARRAPDRLRRRDAGRPRRLARRAAADRDVEPAGRRRGAAAAPQRAGGGGRARRRARAAGRAHDLLHQVAQGGRARRPARPARARRRGRPGGRRPARRPHRPLPRRLHAPAAPRARGEADERRTARGRHDRRARARHRHRRARCGRRA